MRERYKKSEQESGVGFWGLVSAVVAVTAQQLVERRYVDRKANRGRG